MVAGVLLANPLVEAAKCQSRLQEVESLLESIPFDGKHHTVIHR
ncbi:hypothetical protein MycrhDRAFT_3321 [Mycolicibacterium rhodesiae JS60]|nr:hypothetical protein MycrhDRAFT_3321 [Mycolicibacterium rhodesiae JS60]